MLFYPAVLFHVTVMLSFIVYFSYFSMVYSASSFHSTQADSSSPTVAQMGTAVRLAQCRAHCIDAFAHQLAQSQSSLTNEQCMADTDCWMCWDYCQMFQMDYERWGNMCKQPYLCLNGCRVVCSFYASSSDYTDTNAAGTWSFPASPVLQFDRKEGWLRLDWLDVVPLTVLLPPLPHIIYVTFWQSQIGKPWLQLEQTLATFFETRHGEIVISANQGQFVVVAVNRDGVVSTARTNSATSSAHWTTPIPIQVKQEQVAPDDGSGKVRFVLAIVCCSVLAGGVFAAGLVLLYRMLQAQRSRHLLCRRHAVRFRVQSRKRHTSASSRIALITTLNPSNLESVALPSALSTANCDQRYTAPPDRARFEELFKGTIFESPSPFSKWPRFSFRKGTNTGFDTGPSFNI